MAIKVPRLNIRKNTGIMIGAILLAGISVLLVMQYLDRQKKQYQADLSAAMSKGMLQVVVPVRDVPPGTIVDGSNMAMRLYPQDLVYEGAVTAAKWRDYQGRLLVHPVKAGKPLLANDFVAGAVQDFASSLPANSRAVTIAVDNINSINGLIRPGDRVDVLLSSRDNHGRSTGTQVLPLLRRTVVLATGRTVSSDGDSGRTGTKLGESREYSTLTMAVTPDEASSLVLAQQVGTLRVVLASSKIEDESEVPAMTQRELLLQLGANLEPEPDPKPVKPVHVVPPSKPRADSSLEPGGVQFVIGGSRGATSHNAPGAPEATPATAAVPAPNAAAAAALSATLAA